MDRETVVEADFTWVNGAFESNVQVVISGRGVIEQVGLLDVQPTVRLRKRALLPGIVNAHSHAFQRGLRGFGESFPRGERSRTWRETMYDLVDCLDEEEFRNLCRMAFAEMLHHGITTVGEFHYLHHDRSGAGYAFDDVLLEVADEVGIRIVMLCSYYAHGGVGKPLDVTQRRFASENVGDFCDRVAALRERVRSPLQTIGVAPHSIRAATAEEIAAIAAFARENDMALHIHAEERSEEVEESRSGYGFSPVEVLLERDLLAPNVTLIHCTQTPAENLRRIADAGATVCLCPSTEANRGDGVADVRTLVEAGANIAFGTDSNVRISMNEEMRWLEYVQRLQRRERGICVRSQGRTADTLWGWATTGGAKSLGIKAGRIAPGYLADMFAVDITGLTLLGSSASSLLTAFVFGADRACITNTCVAGVWHNWE